jgi:pentatricopeptide repeat protein
LLTQFLIPITKMLSSLPSLAETFSSSLGNLMGSLLFIVGYILFQHFFKNSENDMEKPYKTTITTEISFEKLESSSVGFDPPKRIYSDVSETPSTPTKTSLFQERVAYTSAESNTLQLPDRHIQNPLQQYNIYIRNNLIHRPNVNPVEVLLLMKLEGLEPDTTTYNTLMDLTYRQLNFSKAEELYRELLQSENSQLKPDLITFNTKLKGISIKLMDIKGDSIIDLQSSLVSCSDLEIYQEISFEIEKTLKEITLREMIPNLITFNTLIDLRFRLNNLKEIALIFNQMESLNIDPDRYTQTTFIKGIKRLSTVTLSKHSREDWRIIFSVIQTLKLKNYLTPDEQLYNIVVDVCFKLGFIYKAKELFQDMWDNVESNVKPSPITYGIMMRGLGQNNKLEEVLEIYQKMRDNMIPLNDIALGCLIDACVKCGDIQTATKIIENPENQVMANTVIYTTLLKGFTKEKNFSRAVEIFELMKLSPATEPNLISYNALLECAVQSEEYQAMDDIFSEMLTHSDPDCNPDLITYSTLIKGLAKSHQINRAYQMFKALRSVGNCQLDEILYNSLLDGLVKSNELEKAQIVYDYMKEDQIKPSNVTYSILIKLFGKLGEVDTALNILDEMKASRIQPGVS